MLVISWEVLVGRDIVEIIHDVGVEGVDLAGAHEAEDLHGAVVTNPQLPLVATNVDRPDGGADGPDAPNPAQPAAQWLVYETVPVTWPNDVPDHQLIVTARSLVIRISSREQIVGNIGADVVPFIVPRGRRWKTTNLAHDFLVRELAPGIGVCLDVVLPARP